MKKFTLRLILIITITLFAYVSLFFVVGLSTLITPKIESITFKNLNIFGSTYLRSIDFNIWAKIKNANKKGLILGSSTAYRNINPYILEEATNIDWFNLGSSAQSPNISLLLIKDAIQKTKIDYILLDLFSEYTNSNGNESAIDWIKNSNLSTPVKFRFLTESKLDVKKTNVFLYWSIKKQIPSKKYFSGLKNNGEYIGKGFVCYTPNSITNFNSQKNRKFRVIETNSTIQEIISLCKQKDIKLIINICPVIGLKNISTIEYPFVLNNDDFVKDTNNFRLFFDTCHMTCDGSKKYSYTIANKINKIK